MRDESDQPSPRAIPRSARHAHSRRSCRPRAFGHTGGRSAGTKWRPGSARRDGRLHGRGRGHGSRSEQTSWRVLPRGSVNRLGPASTRRGIRQGLWGSHWIVFKSLVSRGTMVLSEEEVRRGSNGASQDDGGPETPNILLAGMLHWERSEGKLERETRAAFPGNRPEGKDATILGSGDLGWSHGGSGQVLCSRSAGLAAGGAGAGGDSRGHPLDHMAPTSWDFRRRYATGLSGGPSWESRPHTRSAAFWPVVARRAPRGPARAGVLEAVDRLVAFAMAGGLTIVAAAACAGFLATWVPHYLLWPWCRDSDTFATLAQSWDAGILPYRDIRGYNFPGAIYLFWLLGEVIGWGRTWAFYAVDAAALVLLGVTLAAWSRRCLGRPLPGVAAYLVFLTFYLNLDFNGRPARLACEPVRGPGPAGAPGVAGPDEPDHLGPAGRTGAVDPSAHLLFLPALWAAIAEGIEGRALGGRLAPCGSGPIPRRVVPRLRDVRRARLFAAADRGHRRRSGARDRGWSRTVVLTIEPISPTMRQVFARPAPRADDLDRDRAARPGPAFDSWCVSPTGRNLGAGPGGGARYTGLIPSGPALLPDFPVVLVGRSPPAIAVGLDRRASGITPTLRADRPALADVSEMSPGLPRYCNLPATLEALASRWRTARRSRPGARRGACVVRSSTTAAGIPGTTTGAVLIYLRADDRSHDAGGQRPEAAAVPRDQRAGGPALAVPGRVGDLLDVAGPHRPGARVRRRARAVDRLRRRLVAVHARGPLATETPVPGRRSSVSTIAPKPGSAGSRSGAARRKPRQWMAARRVRRRLAVAAVRRAAEISASQGEWDAQRRLGASIRDRDQSRARPEASASTAR